MTEGKLPERRIMEARADVGTEIYVICWAGPEKLTGALEKLTMEELQSVSDALAPLLRYLRGR